VAASVETTVSAVSATAMDFLVMNGFLPGFLRATEGPDAYWTASEGKRFMSQLTLADFLN
jgi:hypothetical protein